jgi:cob(I)alamin adenosyltransferase
MHAIGEVDELNGVIGVMAAAIDDLILRSRVQKIQQVLFVIGANLAGAQTNLVAVPELSQTEVVGLEQWIDDMETHLEPLTQFILPGGTLAAAYSFYARAICRRAERQIVFLNEKCVSEGQIELQPNIQKYVNRLSDALFVLGRLLNKQADCPEITWKK